MSAHPDRQVAIKAQSRLRTWLQLLRLPNLFTVPGDPLVGYLFANGWDVTWALPAAILASLLLYSAGLLMNDLADEAEDLRDRPARPLPSGAVGQRKVWAVATALSVAGLGVLAATGQFAAVVTGTALLAAIALYNWVTKGLPVVGALNMGVCRGLSVLVGAAVGPLATWPMALLAAGGTALFIAAVTNLARHETKEAVPKSAFYLPLVALLFTASAGCKVALYAPERWPVPYLFAVPLFAALWLLTKLLKQKAPLPPLIGSHIRLLLPLQAAFCFLAEPTEIGPICAVALLLLWPIARLFSRWFYAS